MATKKKPAKKKVKRTFPERKGKIWGVPFAIGNSGREKRFKTPVDLQEAIDVYFDECDNHTISVYDKKAEEVKEVVIQIPYTIEGLCEVLDCERQTLLNYEKQKGYEAFFDTIKKAKLKIQRNKLERGLSGQSNPAVSIFDLKNNHGYIDKTEIKADIETESKLKLSVDGKSIDLTK